MLINQTDYSAHDWGTGKRLMRGDSLLPETRAIVLASYGYRWTHENESRSLTWRGKEAPSAPMTTDAEWLKAHLFHVTKSGKLDARYGYCLPAFNSTNVNQR